MQGKGRYPYVVISLVLAVLMALTLIGCGREQAAVQGVSHFEGPLDITGTGSASAPALYFAGDSDSGIYRSAANNLDFATGGTRRLNVSSSGLDLQNLPALNVGAAGTDFTSAGGLTTASTITVTAGGLTISDGDVVVADDLRVTAQTAITVTDTAAFTATGTYQAIQAAGEVTPTITVGTAGDLLVLINISAQTINIADTGIQMLSAAWAAGQYDVLVLWCDGTNWIEISRSNN